MRAHKNSCIPGVFLNCVKSNGEYKRLDQQKEKNSVLAMVSSTYARTKILFPNFLAPV